MFDERSEGDPHDQCAAEIDRLRAERDALQERLVTLQRILSGVKGQRDALRAFAQEVIGAGYFYWETAERHGLVRFDIDAGVDIETPLLTGEQQT